MGHCQSVTVTVFYPKENARRVKEYFCYIQNQLDPAYFNFSASNPFVSKWMIVLLSILEDLEIREASSSAKKDKAVGDSGSLILDQMTNASIM